VARTSESGNHEAKAGPKRLSAEGVALVVKRYVEKLNYDPADFAGHSLRAGLATSAAAAGKSERAIMNQAGHRSLTTVRRYIRNGNLFRENAADKIGLCRLRPSYLLPAKLALCRDERVFCT